MIGIARCGFFLSDRSTPGFVGRLPIARVIERFFADASRRIFRRGRSCIEWRKLLTLVSLVARRFPVADAGGLRRTETVVRPVGRLEFEGVCERVDRGAMSVDAALQLDEIGFPEIAAASHDVRLQPNQFIPRPPRIRETVQEHFMFWHNEPSIVVSALLLQVTIRLLPSR